MAAATSTGTYWERFQEWILPSSTFARSDTPKRDVTYGRVIVTMFYAALTMAFIYTVVRMCWSGRIELFSNLYKVDFIEAPSLAFCPFNVNDTIRLPDDPKQPFFAATKIDPHGGHGLPVVYRNCSFDRSCACVDMDKYHLGDISREQVDDPAGSHGMVARESIEIRTNLTDPSGEHVLKVGIYDSFDNAPDWFYVNQGSMFMGQLELTVWTVVDVSIMGLVNTFKGDLRAMVKNRHIFRYTSQQVGDHSHEKNHETSVRYEMKTFFVKETMSSHRAFSLYTVFVIGALVALRYVVVDAFFHAMLPEWQEKHADHKTRELSGASVWLRNIFCCFLPDDEPHESDHLLAKRAPA